MKKAKYIIELAQGKLSLDGYIYIVSLIKYYLNKYNWPKTILDENTNNNEYWDDDEVLSFTQQLLIFILEKEKLKNYQKIPENYIEYYFKTVLVSYVANKIKENQNKTGLSYDDVKRTSLEILNDIYFRKTIGNTIFWNKENDFQNPVKDENLVNDKIDALPKIAVTEKTKHYKPLVKMAINDIFTLINKPLQQEIIFNQVYKLFDQSSFTENYNNERIEDEIREKVIYQAINKILHQIYKKDVPVYLDYFFSDASLSLNKIAEKYNISKSTVHYKTSHFRDIISKALIPENEKEGIFFLEKLHEKLDELK